MNHPARHIFSPLASLRLTVTLFATAMFLIFAGTLAQAHRGIWSVMHQFFRSPLVWIDLQLFVPEDVFRVPYRFPYPGGYVIGGLLLINLVAAYALRFKFTRKRVGILLLHMGIVLLLIGELVTALWSQEGTMTIDEGSSANFIEDIRHAELAVIDPSHPDHEQVVVIPGSVLTREEMIRHESLPFDVSVRQWMPNSRLFGPATAPPDIKPIATAGIGTRVVAQQVPQVTGADDQTVDAPSAYLTLSHRGRDLGTWLVSAYLDAPEPVTVGGKTYGIQLRFKRTYKPYTIHLIDFRHDKFVGTEKPRNFSSLIRLVDPTRNEDRQALIYMNHPLRYNGETFYQSAFKQDDSGTILQVVRNPGWLIPYVACGLVSAGMLLHFGLGLYRFIRRAKP